MGFVVFFCLSALALAAALAITVRGGPRGRAEGLVAVTLLWNLIIALPIYALGLSGHLSAATLAVGSLATSCLALVGAFRGSQPRRLAGDGLRLLGGQLRLPIDALVLTWRARSLVFLGVAFVALLLPYMALCAYLGQAVPHWDPLWYHDTMVGFTIQNHGFAMVDLPSTLQKVNGYVRLGEMTQLWMVIFSDRRLADLTNLLFAPAIVASAYLLARRYAGVVTAVGWGVAVVLMPACANLLHSTYVDPQNAALLLAGIVFATVDSPRLGDAWLAAIGLALAIGSKGLSLVPVPVVGVIGALLLLRAHWQSRRRAAIATVVGGMALVVGMAATTYVRNYLAFHNPLWPDLKVDISALGIHWPGQMAWVQNGGERVNMNEPLSMLLDHLYALPWTIKGMYHDQTVDYGIGVAWIAIPAGAIALIACAVAAVRRARAASADVAAGDAAAANARAVFAADRAPPIALAIILVTMVLGSPALWAPRYHIAAVGLLGALVAWVTGRAPRDRLGESLVSTVIATSLMMFYWTPAPHYCFSPSELLALARKPAIVRELDRDLRAPTLLAVGRAREKELGPGKLLVFNDHYGAFPSLFWNNTFSNRIMYLPSGPNFLTRAAAAGATWVVLAAPSEQKAALAPGAGWQEVGLLNPINGGTAYRRVAVAAGAKPGAKSGTATAKPATPPAPPAPPAPAPPKKAAATPGRTVSIPVPGSALGWGPPRLVAGARK